MYICLTKPHHDVRQRLASYQTAEVKFKNTHLQMSTHSTYGHYNCSDCFWAFTSLTRSSLFHALLRSIADERNRRVRQVLDQTPVSFLDTRVKVVRTLVDDLFFQN